MTAPTPTPASNTSDAYSAEIDLERERWTEIERLCLSLSAADRVRPGYFRDPDWSAKDMVGHLGAWMAEAEQHLLQIEAGNYSGDPSDHDIDALNARFLDALRDVDWATAWVQVISARAQMLRVWVRLPERSAAADAWVRKSGADHYAEHLPRLREWVAEVAGPSST